MKGSRTEVEAGLEDNLTRLWRFGLTLSGDRAQADDLVQATCVRALERSHQFKPGTRINSWLFRILLSIWRNTTRAQAVRRGQGLIDVADAHLESRDCDGETRHFLLQTLETIEALPEGQRAVMVLIGVEGLTYAEAADALDIPIGTIMSRLSSARRSLGETLQEGEKFSAPLNISSGSGVTQPHVKREPPRRDPLPSDQRAGTP